MRHANIQEYMYKNKTVLITGGSGFIGANLARALFEDNDVHLLVRPESNLWRIEDIKKRVNIYRSEMLNLGQLTKLVKNINPQIIYHLASYGNSSFQVDPKIILETNIVGTANLLIASRDIDFECLVNTGSSSEYGFKNQPMKESDLLEPNSFYAATKSGATYFVSGYAQTLNKPVVTVRPFSVYGPFEDSRRLIPIVIMRTLNHKPVMLTPKTARRDFIYIQDVVDFYILLASKISKIRRGSVFNLGTGKQNSNNEILEMIGKIVKECPRVIKGGYPNRVWDSGQWVADMKLVQTQLSWKARFDLFSGLAETINWFKSSPNLMNYYGDSIT